MDSVAKQQASPFSTGSGGATFETRVQAAFTVLMLTGRSAPCLPSYSIHKLGVQVRWDDISTDDLIVYAQQKQTKQEAKLLAQIKHDIAITSSNTIFADVIRSAWYDFRSDHFNVGTDRIALITGPLSSADTNHVRPILEWARHSASATEFLKKVDTPNLSSDAKRNKLEAFRVQLKAANGDTDVTEEQLWSFLKAFYLVGYDLDTESGGTLALLHSLIANCADESAHLVWARVIEALQNAGQNAGTITSQTLPKDIVDIFAATDSSDWSADVARLKEHGSYILEGIRTTVGDVHVEQKDVLTQLLDMTEWSNFVFVTGKRGAGKSSLIRKFSSHIGEHAPLFCLRTEDLDKPHLDNVFSAIGLNGSLSDIEASFALIPKKYLVIESLEKVLELDHQAAFTDLLQLLKKQGGWTVVATGRDYAYPSIRFNFLQPSGVDFKTLSLEGFADEQVQELCQKAPTLQKLVGNPALMPLLKSPFFADLAHRVLATGTKFSSEDGEKQFRAAVWRDVIAKEHQRTDGLPAKRKKNFIDVSVSRAKRMVYGVPEDEFDNEAILKLEEDNLIRRETSSGLVSPAHDVLEDWALERFIDDTYRKHSTNIQTFLDAVGHEPAMNRAFRLWLHQRLRFGEDVGGFICAMLTSEDIQRYWQDEAIAAVLQGENPGNFLLSLREDLLNERSDLLTRFCFVLRIACQAPEQNASETKFNHNNILVDSLFLKPFGKGWEAIIRFLYDNKEQIPKSLLPHVVAVLNDWVSVLNILEPLPELAREAGLLALHLLEGLKDSYRDDGDRKKLLSVIIRTAPGFRDEFERLLDNDVFVEKVGRYERRPGYVEGFCKMAFSIPETVFLCRFMPDLLIELAKREWFFELVEEEEEPWYARSRIKVAECFGLHEHRHEFYPASGAKGPFRHLLNYHPRKGLDFLLELFNRSARKYAHSNLDAREYTSDLKVELPEPLTEQLTIHLNDGATVQQYYSGRLWLAYRGHTVIPYLLQSALMALENWLIEFVEYFDSEGVAWVFDYILRNSNSVMTTAVLGSVATGFPEKVGKAALPLLRTPELYSIDIGRRVREMAGGEANWFALSHDPLAKLYEQERREAALRPWRKECLEFLICRFQFSPLRDDALAAVDMLRASAPDSEGMRFLIHRIDSRNWEAIPNSENSTIAFMPKDLEPDLLEIQEQTQKDTQESGRFIRLHLWAHNSFQRKPLEREYYASGEEVLAEAKALLGKLMDGAASESARMYHGGILTAAAVLLRDYTDELTEEDALWCASLIFQVLGQRSDSEESFADAMDYDGLGAAASVLPVTLDFASSGDKFTIKALIVAALTHTDQNIRHGAAEGIRQHLWARDPDFAQRCVEGAVEYARFECSHRLERRRVYYLEDEEKEAKMVELQKEKAEFRKQLVAGELSSGSKVSLLTHDPQHILVPCLMIPEGSVRPEHVTLLSTILSLFFEIEQKQHNRRHDEDDKIEINYKISSEFKRRFANYLFPLVDVGFSQYVEQLREGCDVAPGLIASVDIHLAAEAERRNKKEVYWHFWATLSSKVQQIAIDTAYDKSDFGRREKRELIRRILKSDIDWQPIDFETQDIALGRELILEFAKNAGRNPDVFEALAKLMHYFPTIFSEPGMHILAKHQKEEGGTHLLSGVNTTFYLERAVQRFLQFDQTGPLSKHMHESCLILLNAVVETASSRGYYLREHLVRSRKIA